MSSARIKGFVITSVLTTIASFAGGHVYSAFHDHGRALLAGGFLLTLAGTGVYLLRRA